MLKTTEKLLVFLYLEAALSFRGLIPRLFGEVITVWLTAGLAYLVNRFLLNDDTDPKIREQTPYIASVSKKTLTTIHFN